MYTEAEMKMVFYRLMRPVWKMKFDASGNDITDGGFTWDNLVRWMAAQERAERAREAMVSRSRAAKGSGRGRGRGYGRGRGGYGRGFGRGTGRPYGRGYTGRSSSSYGYQGRGYSGYSGRSSGYSQGQGRGQVRSYDGNNYGPPAQRQRTNDGGYVNGGGHRAPFAGRGRGGYQFRQRNQAGRAAVGSGAYHADHYHVGDDSEQVNPSGSNDSDDFQEPTNTSHSQNDYPYDEPEVQPDDHYFMDGEEDFDEYYGDY